MARQSLRPHPLAHVARPGENVVTLKARPFTIFHELEPAYLRGDFSLKPTARGFVVAPDQPLKIGTAEPVLTHSNNPDGTMWLSGGIGFTSGADDRAPFLVLDLGQSADLAAVEIWNYCEGHVRNLTSRGTKTLRISTGPAPDALTATGTFELARSTGPARGQHFPLQAAGVRYVKLECLANHAGVKFPATGEPPDNGFVGLAEVVFLGTANQPLKGVTVHQASSELATHRRLAKYVVDGSGLAGARPGWNEQGHPFYAHGVAYRQSFQLPPTRGRYVVSLPAWYGSIARVKVNDDLAGYISAPPMGTGGHPVHARRRQHHRGRRVRHPEEHARTASRRPCPGQRLARHVPEWSERRPTPGRPVRYRWLRPVRTVPPPTSRTERHRRPVVVRLPHHSLGTPSPAVGANVRRRGGPVVVPFASSRRRPQAVEVSCWGGTARAGWSARAPGGS
ncbi:MAG: hypothetical protein M5U12_10200 [Verrucomicrobia bacterium]|nr:hypothetical protein [Verrucomicrobiota bacterium]